MAAPTLIFDDVSTDIDGLTNLMSEKTLARIPFSVSQTKKLFKALFTSRNV